MAKLFEKVINTNVHVYTYKNPKLFNSETLNLTT